MAPSSQADAVEDHGIKQLFGQHLDLALESMPPPQAFEAAQHATRQYLAGHVFKSDGSGNYHKLERREGSDAMR